MDLLGLYFEYFSVYGVGLHIVIAVIFAIHAVRNRQELYWLWILFVFPFLGSVVYFIAVYLPGSRMQRNLKYTADDMSRMLNPGKTLREARKAYDLTPSIKNQVLLANALLARGQTAESVSQFDECLARLPSIDLDVYLSAAHARFENKQPEHAVDLLRKIKTENNGFKVQEVTLLSAQSLAAMGNNEAARAQFEYLVSNHGSIEARVEYAIWLLSQNDTVKALKTKAEIDQTARHWPKHAKYLNRDLMKRLNQAFAGVK